MEVNTQRSLQDDQTSECGTFGSNYCPSSQSRKISIGIMTDSVAKKRLEPLREEKVAEQRENIGGLKRRVRETGETKQTEAPQQASSPWRSTKSKSLVSEPPQRRNGTSNVRSVGGRLKKQRREIDAPVTHSVQFFTGQTPMSHFSGGKQETFKGFTYKRKGSKNGDSQEFTFANAKEGAVPDKVVAEDKNEEGRTECLKMKLWEILGKVSSPKSQPSDSRAREKNADNSKSDQGQVHKTDADGKPLRNSDTIETDSENPDLNLTKPVTRSLTRRRGLTKVRPEKKRGAPSSNNRQKLEENNAFSFAEGLLQKGNAKANGGSSIFLEKKGYKNLSSFRPRSNCFSENNGTGADQKGCSVKAVHVNGGPSTSTRNNSPRKSSIIEPSNVGFSHDNADEIQEKTRRSETLISADRTSLLGNKMKNIFRSPSRDVTENSVSKTGNKEREDHQLLREDSQKSLHKQRSKEQEDITSTKGEKKGQQEESIGPSLKNIVDTNEDFASPTLKFRTPSLTPSPTFKPRSEKTNEAPNSSALKDTGFLVKNIRSFRTLQASKAASVSHSESSDDEAAEFKNSPQTNVTLPQGKVNEENYLSDSSSEDKDSSEEGSPIRKGQRKGDISCPVIRPVERSTFFFSPVKDFRSHEGSRDKYDPISPFLKGTGIGEIDCAEELLLSEQNQRDELERVVMLFALSLEKFRNKMRMATRNKSSDILLSVSEEISLQLQNVKSQIQKDLGKLAGFSKLKRKQIETTFQEQEEKLKMIHDKFKEDILRHLQDCKSSVEDLEEHQTVISEAVKKQKASHQKLLMQVEEAIGERLNDAQRSIESVHKMSKPDFEGKKMLFAGDDKWYMDTGKKATSTDRLGRRHVKDHMGTREVHAFAPTFSQTELKLHGNSVIGRSYTSQSNSTYRGRVRYESA